MQMRELKDDFGGSLTVWDYNGYFLAPAPEDYIAKEFPNIPRWKGRDDDVVLCNFARSGTHWIWEILNMILSEKAERIQGVKQDLMLEFMKESYFDGLPSPRIINTHIYYNYLPDDIKRRKCKIVLCLRNPKDVMVSFFNLHSQLTIYKFTGTWEHYIQRFVNGQTDYGSWFDYTLNWEKVMKENTGVPIHVVHYEDMKLVEYNLEYDAALGSSNGLLGAHFRVYVLPSDPLDGQLQSNRSWYSTTFNTRYCLRITYIV